MLQVTGVQVLDDDGILSPDESAPLSISIANVGDMSAFGPVNAELSVVSAPSTVSVTNDSPSFGFVNAGASKDDDDFSITVEGGTLGDSIILQLDCTDTQNTYTDQFELVLGEAPWYSLSSIPDDVGMSMEIHRLICMPSMYAALMVVLKCVLNRQQRSMLRLHSLRSGARLAVQIMPIIDG